MANPHLHVRYKGEVRSWWVILAACSCYQPNQLSSGSPCSVDQPTCPNGQTCIRVDDGFRCEANFGGTPDGPTPNDGPPPGTHRIAYPASASVCVSDSFPDATFCADIYSPNSLVVTELDDTTMLPLRTYLRFDLDGSVTGTVAAVTLQMTALDTAQAASDQSGSVWQVSVFTQQSIASTTPGKIGSVLATDRGTVVNGAVVEWPLASSSVGANSVLCLEIESTSTNNVIYDKAAPPTLLVDVY